MAYSKKIAQKIVDLVSTGQFTIVDICEQVGIARSTYFKWKKEKIDFSDSIEEAEESGMLAIKDRAVSGLFKLVDTFEYFEEKVVSVPDKNGKPIIKEKSRVRKIIMPNQAAIMFALTNRDPKTWKNSSKIDLTSNGETLGFQNFLMKTLPKGIEVKEHSETESEIAADVYTPDHRD